MKVYLCPGRPLAYLPITKNASTTYSRLFESLGWHETQLDLLDKDCEIFSHIRNPIERHFMGTAEFLVTNHLTDLLEDTKWQHVWAKAVMDVHSYPIAFSVGPLIDKILWIPIHPGIDTDRLTIDFLKERGIIVDTIRKLNVSSDNSMRKVVYNKLINIRNNFDRDNTLSHFYDLDIVLWIKVLNSL